MAFSPQTFTIGQAYSAAIATQMDENIDQVRAHHKGPSAPASPTAGTSWLDDTTANGWIFNYYDGAAWIPYGVLDSTGNDFGVLTTQVSTMEGIRLVNGSPINNYTFQGLSIAVSVSVVMIPTSEFTATGDMFVYTAEDSTADGAHAFGMVSFVATGTPAITQILSNANMSFGHTTNSGIWVRKLSSGTTSIRTAVLRIH
jgi:hypothetical protein